MALDADQVASCATEPIHIPGAVQAHGCLLVMGEDLSIEQASRNCEEHLGVPMYRLLGRGRELSDAARSVRLPAGRAR